MTKISEFISVLTGYANQVHLVEEFTDSNKNRDRMQNYRPIKSHRASFQKITLAQKPAEEKCFLVTGSYGTGKSHLSLMLANYFSQAQNAPEMVNFYRSWEERDPETGKFIRDLRGSGRYLVALGEYGQGKDFEEMILSAIQTALAREGNASIALDSHYKEAARRIQLWEDKQKEGRLGGVLNDFKAELEARYPSRTLDTLKRDLLSNDAQAMSDFEDVFREVYGGAFSYDKDNLINILEDLLGSPAFSQIYKGVVIIADEFGYILDNARLNIDIFQRFAEMCRDGFAGRQLIFIGTGHKSFNLYGAGRLAQADFRVVSDRVKEVPLAVEEIEQIIGALIRPNTAHPAWKTDVLEQDYWTTNLAQGARAAGIFAHLDVPHLQSEIIEAVYPMHPMAVHCLIRLSIDMGSNARSVFTFFTGGSEFSLIDGSYPWFINNDTLKNGRPNLYTADLLTRYFDTAIRPDNAEVREAVRGHIRNYQASRDEALRLMRGQLHTELDPLEDRLLRLMLVYKICDVPTNAANLALGLYCATQGERTALDNLLSAMKRDKVLYLPLNGLEYEFRRSESEDFEGMIAAFKADPRNRPTDMVATVSSLTKMNTWLDANGYNGDFAEDKRMQRLFVRPGDLTSKYPGNDGKQVSFWQMLAQRQNAVREWKDRYEGSAVYVLCETLQDVADARAAVSSNTHEQIIVGIPSQAIPIEAAVMDLLAVKAIEASPEFSKFGLPDQARLRDELIGNEQNATGMTGTFMAIRQRYLEGKELAWFGKDGRSLLTAPKTEFEPADVTMRQLFPRRNKFSSAHFNPIRIKTNFVRDAAFTDAMRALVEFERPITIDKGAAESRGERRYLDGVFAANAALKLVGQYVGTVGTFQVETDLAQYAEKLPALAELITRLKGLQSGASLAVHKVLNDLAAPPFGQGPAGLMLALAYAARFFGDELRVKPDPARVGYASLADPAMINALVLGQHPSATFERTPISQPKRELINGLYDIFATTPLPAAAVQRTVSESWGCVKSWWDQLQNLQKCESLHAADSSGCHLIDFMKRNAATVNPHQAITNDLPATFGLNDGAELTSAAVNDLLRQIRDGKLALVSRAQDLKDTLLDNLMHEWAPDASQFGEYQNAITAWYAGLDAEQKDLNAQNWQTPASRALLRLVPRIESLPRAFLTVLPAEDGYVQRGVDDWVDDRSADYHNKLAAAKALIDRHALRVPAPTWAVSGADYRIEKRGGKDVVYYRGQVNLKVTSPNAGLTVFVNDGSEDPRTAAQRLPVPVEETIELTKDTTIRMVVRETASQEYGKVIDVDFRNENRRYEPVVIKQTLDPLEREYNFVYPKDSQALRVFLRGFVSLISNGNVLSKEDILAEFKHLLDEDGQGPQES